MQWPWRDEYDRQATPEVMEAVGREATALVGYLERTTGWRDDQSIDDRRHTVIVKLFEGRITWDPARVDLKGRLVGAIASDVSHELERACRRTYLSLDDESLDLERLERDIHAAHEGSDEVSAESLWEPAMAALRIQAANDRAVLAIIDALATGHFEKREIVACTGLSSRAYMAARDRLVRMARNLGDIRAQIKQIDERAAR